MIRYIFIIVFIVGLIGGASLLHAKGGDDQDQIILLNDSAAALEDSNPDLSKKLTLFAEEKEKEWKASNANKDNLPKPVTDQELSILRERMKLLKAAAIAVGPTYPLIAQGLDQMVKDINKPIEVKK